MKKASFVQANFLVFHYSIVNNQNTHTGGQFAVKNAFWALDRCVSIANEQVNELFVHDTSTHTQCMWQRVVESTHYGMKVKLGQYIEENGYQWKRKSRKESKTTTKLSAFKTYTQKK